MPNCFQLFKEGEKEPVSLNKVDEEICNLLGVAVHPKKYGGGFVENGYNWFDSIGWDIAVNGLDLHSKELLDKYQAEVDEATEKLAVEDSVENDIVLQIHKNGLKILNYLRENYTSRSFYSPK